MNWKDEEYGNLKDSIGPPHRNSSIGPSFFFLAMSGGLHILLSLSIISKGDNSLTRSKKMSFLMTFVVSSVANYFIKNFKF